MKIAYIVSSFLDNSVINIVKWLAEYFGSQGHYVKVFYFFDKFDVKMPCEIQKIGRNEPFDFDSFDIIHSHGFRPDKYLYQFRKKIKKAKTVSTLHVEPYDYLHFRYNWAVSLLFVPRWLEYHRSLDAVVQVSDFMLDRFKKTVSNSVLVYNGPDVRFEDVESHKHIEEKIKEYKERGFKVVCSYSVLNRGKGLQQIIRALAVDSSFAYICIGEGKERPRLEKLATSLGVADRCTFFGFQKKPYLIMRYADIYCCSSYSESFCLALFEAGAVGSSVVCGKISVFTEPLSENEVTFFELDNIDSLVTALNEAFEHKEEKSRLLKERVERDFSQEQMLSGYETVYGKLLASSVSMIEGGGYSYKLNNYASLSLNYFQSEVLHTRKEMAA